MGEVDKRTSCLRTKASSMQLAQTVLQETVVTIHRRGPDRRDCEGAGLEPGREKPGDSVFPSRGCEIPEQQIRGRSDIEIFAGGDHHARRIEDAGCASLSRV